MNYPESLRPVRQEMQCALRGQTLRLAAQRAGAEEADRAVVQYGAGAALDRAATAWSFGHHAEATAWMRAAESQLLLAGIPIPWPLTHA